uniref:Uncharacterized protein n=1 Tax=Oryza brachyantha TaxID=4533 RepID=J3MCQ2_ORYBR
MARSGHKLTAHRKPNRAGPKRPDFSVYAFPMVLSCILRCSIVCSFHASQKPSRPRTPSFGFCIYQCSVVYSVDVSQKPSNPRKPRMPSPSSIFSSGLQQSISGTLNPLHSHHTTVLHPPTKAPQAAAMSLTSTTISSASAFASTVPPCHSVLHHRRRPRFSPPLPALSALPSPPVQVLPALPSSTTGGLQFPLPPPLSIITCTVPLFSLLPPSISLGVIEEFSQLKTESKSIGLFSLV